jgi:hypothetical protein
MDTKIFSDDLKRYIEEKIKSKEYKNVKFADYKMILEDCKTIRLLLTELTLSDVKTFEGLVNQFCLDVFGFANCYKTKFIDDELEFRIKKY